MLSSTNRKDKMFNVRKIYMKLSPLNLKSDKPAHKEAQQLDDLVVRTPLYQEHLRQLAHLRQSFEDKKQQMRAELERLTQLVATQQAQKLRLQTEKINYDIKIRALEMERDRLRVSRYPQVVPQNLQYLRQFLFSIHGEQVNVDMMSYEELMQLEEQIGRVNRGLTEDKIKLLEEEDARTQLLTKSCPICLEDFARQEKIIKLRCQHVFHGECIVAWLKTEKHCVLCKKEVLEE